ncbi:MAG: hypothetical protein ACFCVA_02240 [Gammaproteobacteria bacterium]
MDPYQRLIEIARHLETFESREAITRVIDELEFIQELLPPEQQDLANQLMERWSAGRQIASDTQYDDA